MKNFVYVGFLVIFISMVFILLIFENFSRMSISCSASGCSNMSMFFTMLFGFFITGTFLVLDSIVGSIIMAEKPWEKAKAYKKTEAKNKQAGKLAELEKEYGNLKKFKSEAEKQYYKGKFDTETFKKMLDEYDKKAIEVKSRINDLKSEMKAKGGRK